MIKITSKPKAESYNGYEYHEQLVSDQMAPLYMDSYPFFGWELEGKARFLAGVNKSVVKFKRNRHLANRVELTRLQRRFESDVKDIEAMEQSKILTASMAAYSIGVAGCAFLAGSVFAFIGGLVPLSIILAIPGILSWSISYFCYRAINQKKAAEVQPYIEQKYEDIYVVCERAHALLV